MPNKPVKQIWILLLYFSMNFWSKKIMLYKLMSWYVIPAEYLSETIGNWWLWQLHPTWHHKDIIELPCAHASLGILVVWMIKMIICWKDAFTRLQTFRCVQINNFRIVQVISAAIILLHSWHWHSSNVLCVCEFL